MPETLSAIMSAGRNPAQAPALYVGLAGDAPRTPAARYSLAAFDRVEIGRGETRRLVRARADGMETGVLTLVDSRMSTQHARLTRVGAGWVLDDVGSKNGTWLRGTQITRQALGDGDAIVLGHTALVFRTAGGELPDQDSALAPAAPGLATLSSSLADKIARLVTVAPSALPVQLGGESGTGKEVMARALHTLSRRAGAFVAVSCGAIPATMIEAELFGHRRGAYTSATEDRPGLVRSADGGTLFLDEIAELPPSSQAALLRVLQEGEVMPLGADRPVKVDVRLVTATHKDLEAEVTAGRFRADLRARLLGVAVELPPLRARMEDLGSLVAEFLERHAARSDVAFSADAVLALYGYAWPLNIRELERALAAAATIAKGRIEVAHLPDAVTARAPTAIQVIADLDDEDRRQREQLRSALDRHTGNVAAVARELGKDPTQIRRWMKKLGLDRRKT